MCGYFFQKIEIGLVTLTIYKSISFLSKGEILTGGMKITVHFIEGEQWSPQYQIHNIISLHILFEQTGDIMREQSNHCCWYFWSQWDVWGMTVLLYIMTHIFNGHTLHHKYYKYLMIPEIPEKSQVLFSEDQYNKITIRCFFVCVFCAPSEHTILEPK